MDCCLTELYSAGFEDFHLSIHSDMAAVAKAMASSESGLEVRDRMWLKITIPNAFIGKPAVSLKNELERGEKMVHHNESHVIFSVYPVKPV